MLLSTLQKTPTCGPTTMIYYLLHPSQKHTLAVCKLGPTDTDWPCSRDRLWLLGAAHSRSRQSLPPTELVDTRPCPDPCLDTESVVAVGADVATDVAGVDCDWQSAPTSPSRHSELPENCMSSQQLIKFTQGSLWQSTGPVSFHRLPQPGKVTVESLWADDPLRKKSSRCSMFAGWFELASLYPAIAGRIEVPVGGDDGSARGYPSFIDHGSRRSSHQSSCHHGVRVET